MDVCLLDQLWVCLSNFHFANQEALCLRCSEFAKIAEKVVKKIYDSPKCIKRVFTLPFT